jgi:membrane-associated phospholipid phosphatase
MTEDAESKTGIIPPRMIGHYEILGSLGRGGMGEVFLARDTTLDRRVAVKILSPEVFSDAERLHRFRREAKTLAALNHPNIITIHSIEEVQGIFLLVMELVEGKTLRGVVQEGGLSLPAFLDIAIPLTEALSAAHGKGITHRDIKPENIMVTGSGWVKVLDFGLAKSTHTSLFPGLSGDSETRSLTQKGCILGTVHYMSPEQAEGKPLDQRSDIFSLGIVFYEMLTGEKPFKGDSAATVISSILRDSPCPVRQLKTDIPKPLERIVLRCLEKNPEARIQSAVELHDQLKKLRREIELGEVLSTRKQPAEEATRAPQPFRITRGKVGLTLLLLLVFGLNYLETAVETAVKARTGVGSGAAHQLALAATWLEGRLSFENHDVTNPVAVYGYSFSYFFLLPLLLLLTLLVLARRPGITPFRVFSLSLVVTYAASLPFFLFFPVPERWSFPDSNAILLSDLWSSRLIEAIRPVSGLDNCFPSFHVASTVVIVLVWFLYRLRFRAGILALGMTVILSTFVLGIHWLGDIGAGLAVGILSVAVALRLNRRLSMIQATASA